MSADEDLVRELVRLRRGWGVHGRALRKRTGPHLMRLCGIADADNNGRIRERIRQWLHGACTDLPPQLARALQVAYALDRSHQYPSLTARVESYANEQKWAPRTARRRIDHATRLVVQAALDADAAGEDAVDAVPPGVFAAIVRLDARSRNGPTPDAVVLRVPVPADRFDLLIRFESG